MKRRRQILWILFCLLVLAGCAGFNLERRHYRKGWQLEWGNRPKDRLVHRHRDDVISESKSVLDCTQSCESATEPPEAEEPKNQITFSKTPEESSIEPLRIQSPFKQVLPFRPKVTAQKLPVEGHAFPWMAAFAGLIVLPFFPYRRVSRWASKHRWQAQSAIGAGSLLLGVGAWMAGNVAARHGFALPESAGMWSASLALAGLVAYPTAPRKRLSYGVQKSLDMALLSTGLVWAFSLGQQTFWSPGSFPIDAHWFSALSGKFEKALLDSGLWMGNPDPGGKIAGLYAAEVGLIILSVAAFGVLLALLAALSCNLACSGNVALSNVVLIGGFLLLTTGLVFLIRYIHRAFRRKREIQRHGGVPVP